ncbi:MAG: hypothetical protein K6T16_02730 [Candidatus Pacearchaeota archaeon]|nr:hypothetical protein [Candidatus Pacearchaeota archaeon]
MRNLEELIEKLKKEELFTEWKFHSVMDKKRGSNLIFVQNLQGNQGDCRS